MDTVPRCSLLFTAHDTSKKCSTTPNVGVFFKNSSGFFFFFFFARTYLSTFSFSFGQRPFARVSSCVEEPSSTDKISINFPAAR